MVGCTTAPVAAACAVELSLKSMTTTIDFYMCTRTTINNVDLDIVPGDRAQRTPRGNTNYGMQHGYMQLE